MRRPDKLNVLATHESPERLTIFLQLTMHLRDSASPQLEIFDTQKRSLFLKKTDVESLDVDAMAIGAVVTLFARQMTITGYTDDKTKEYYDSIAETKTVVLLDEALESVGCILHAVASVGARPLHLRLLRDGASLGRGGPSPVGVLQFAGPSVGAKWEKVATELRGVATLDADSGETASKVISDPPALVDASRAEHGALLLVRPHAATGAPLAAIVDAVESSGFALLGASLVCPTRRQATALFAPYKGVSSNYIGWIDDVASGPCLALFVLLREEPEHTVRALRTLCGAHDPEVAKVLHPESLRAKWGIDSVRNACHCTDLAGDGPLEVEVFFRLEEGPHWET